MERKRCNNPITMTGFDAPASTTGVGVLTGVSRRHPI